LEYLRDFVSQVAAVTTQTLVVGTALAGARLSADRPLACGGCRGARLERLDLKHA